MRLQIRYYLHNLFIFCQRGRWIAVYRLLHFVLQGLNLFANALVQRVDKAKGVISNTASNLAKPLPGDSPNSKK